MSNGDESRCSKHREFGAFCWESPAPVRRRGDEDRRPRPSRDSASSSRRRPRRSAVPDLLQDRLDLAGCLGYVRNELEEGVRGVTRTTGIGGSSEASLLELPAISSHAFSLSYITIVGPNGVCLIAFTASAISPGH